MRAVVQLDDSGLRDRHVIESGPFRPGGYNDDFLTLQWLGSNFRCLIPSLVPSIYTNIKIGVNVHPTL